MTGKIVHIPSEESFMTLHDHNQIFKMEIEQGLLQKNKFILSKYFYDDRGCELFNQITQHPDYYLTRCEVEILTKYKKELSNLLNTESINLIELGPGEGIKTLLLIEQFLKDSIQFSYSPIDISTKYLKKIVNELNQKLPQLKLTAIHSDFFKGLEWLSVTSERRNLVLFLGSSIGNFDLIATEDFLRHLWSVMHDGDYLLIGFDLKKDPAMLMRAYNDSNGITEQFNFNLFLRINRELNANFDIKKFRHYATYNVYKGAMESYLISLENQIITIGSLEKTFNFEAFEPIHVEYSFKYMLSQIQRFAKDTGFEIIKNFTDSNNFFVDSLWRVCK